MSSSLGNEIRVCLTGGAGQIAYSLIPHLCNGSIFGETLVHLNLLDIPPALDALKGVKMEIQDAGFQLVRQVITTSSPEEAFNQVDLAILVGGFPRKQGMTRGDLLTKNAQIMRDHGHALNKLAKPTAKVVVVANPANTNALMISHFAPNIPRENVTCLTQLDHIRLHGLLLEKLKALNPERFLQLGHQHIRNGIIWGNHSATQVPDPTHSEILVDNKWEKVCDLIPDKGWLEGEMIATVQKRGATIIEARKLSSAMSAAAAIKEHLISWIKGTKEGEYTSFGVLSNGNPYGIEENLMYSFPVTCRDGQWQIVPELTCSDQEKLTATQDELKEERSCVIGLMENAENIPAGSYTCTIS